MTTPKDLLGKISGGKVLDVATGGGAFINFLMEGLQDWTAMIGIDTSERAEAAFKDTFQDQRQITFMRKDAAKLEFPDASFDTVSIANSLHHLPDLPASLTEMLRVLKPGGNCIVFEMCRDGQTETQLTHVLLHDWWGAIDTAEGVCHRQTYTRQAICDLVGQLGLLDLQVHDFLDLSGDPRDPGNLEQLGPVIDRYQERAAQLPDGKPLVERGEELRRRVKEIGFHGATEIFLKGIKS
jgi:SAM-dependent methyltransferase